MTKDERAKVRVACQVEGHTDQWIEFDTTEWGMDEFEHLMGAYSLNYGLSLVKRNSVAWRVSGSNGAVKHPGRHASDDAWKRTWQSLGPDGLLLSDWLCNAPAIALLEVVQLNRKRAFGADAGDDEQGTSTA